MTTVTDRINTLAVDSTESMFDALAQTQRQNAQFAQLWFNTVEANQKTAREFATRTLKQAQEAQQLWLQLGRETYKATTEAYREGMNTQIETLRQANGKATKAETAAK